MNNVEIEIVRKANEAFLATDNDKKLTDAKLMQIANEVETDGAKKHADLLFSLAEEYNLPTDKCFVILEEHRQAYRQSQLDEIENKIIDIAHFGKNIEIGEKPDYDKLLIALKERETLKNHSKAEMVNAKKSLLKDLKKIESEAKESVIKTGFSKLDEKLGGGLRNSRLYGLGGISSLGKTTIVLNIVENIATDEKDKDGNITKAGRDVLIFSLEMARTELLAKILSKRTFEPVLKNSPNDIKKWEKEAVSLIDLYNAKYSQEKAAKISEFKNKYLEETAPRLNIMEGIGNITVDTVRNTVEMFIEKNRPEFKPVVIIDFLQILYPLNERSTDKKIVDRNISELKILTRDLDLAVIAIS
jgi:replicative DNA helicase